MRKTVVTLLAAIPAPSPVIPAPSSVIPAPSSVFPAKAGIPLSYESRRQKRDPRLRGDDELRGVSEGEET